ncbi:MAG: histidine kinase [Chitinophagaceae bacterium]|nr:histidine kinase [Chitinophagaceae bacterium]
MQAITRDSRGFLWVGTASGLCRFNGRRFDRIALQDEHTGWLAEQDIKKLQLDSSFNLWLLLPNEVGVIHTKTLKYYRIKKGIFTAIGLSSNSAVTVFSKDSLFVFDGQRTLHTARAYTLHHKLVKDDGVKAIEGIYNGMNGHCWVSSGNGLWQVEDNWKFKHMLSIEQADQPEAVTIRDVLQWSPEKVFLASYGRGVLVYNPQHNRVAQLPDFSERTTTKSLALWKDTQGKTWLLAAADRKWLMIDPEALSSHVLVHTPGDINSFPFFNQSTVLYTDSQGISWTGNEDGLAAIDPFRQQMHRVQFNSLFQWKGKPVFDGVAFSLLHTHFGFAVGGWYGKGWHWFSRDWKHLYSAKQIHGTHQIPWQGVYGQYAAGPNAFWLSTDSGLVFWEKGKSKLFLPPQVTHADELIFRKISPLPDSMLMIVARKGIFYFDTRQRAFKKSYSAVKGNNYGLPDTEVMDAWQSKNGTVYLSTRLGVWMKKAQEAYFTVLADLSNGAPTNLFMGITEDDAGIIWFGSANGIMAYNPRNQQVKYERYTPAAKLFKLQTDGKNRIWAISSDGLLCRLSENNWLQFTTANSGWPLNYADGYFEKDSGTKLYAGANTWHVDFDPVRLIEYLPQARVQLEGAQVNDSLILAQNNRVVLPQGTNVFSLLVHDLNFNGSGNNALLYRLGQSRDGKWEQVTDNRIMFSNLSPGSYLVEVKGSLQWNMKGEVNVFTITIMPFWYQTVWFKFVSLILAGLLMVLLVRYLLARQQNSARYKAQLREAQMQALRTQMKPHFIFNSLNSINSLILDAKTFEASAYLTTFSKLMRTTLDITQSNTIKLQKELEALRLYIEMEMTRIVHFDYELVIDKHIDVENIEVPPLILQPFVENAIWHGLSSKKDAGMLSVRLKWQSENVLQVSIEDNGIGRAHASNLKKAGKAHKSLGIEITRNRLILHDPRNYLSIQDLVIEGIPEGTLVNIYINV